MDPRYKSPTANVDIDVDDDFRDIEQFTSVLKWMLWVGAFTSAVGVIASVLLLTQISRPIASDTLTRTLMGVVAVAVLSSLLFFATAIVFGRWIVLAHRNLPALGARYIEVTPGWAVGWFFIPVVYIWFPYRAMRFLWRASHSTQRPGVQGDEASLEAVVSMAQGEIATRILGCALFIVASILVARTWEAQRVQRENPGEFDPAPGFADAA